MTGKSTSGSRWGSVSATMVRLCLRVFQVLALAEGGLLPAVLAVAVVHWMTGHGTGLVAVVGATHGAVFTAYVVVTPFVAWLLHWSPRRLSVALSVAFVPFATWAFERRVRPEIADRLVRHRH